MCTQDVMAWLCSHEKDYGDLQKCKNYGKKDKDGNPLCKGTKTVLRHSGTCAECST